MPEVPVQFEGSQAAVINYDVPLPTNHTGKRLVALDLGISPKSWLAATKDATSLLQSEGIAVTDASGSARVNHEAAFKYWKREARKAGITAAQADKAFSDYLGQNTAVSTVKRLVDPPDGKGDNLPEPDRPPPNPSDWNNGGRYTGGLRETAIFGALDTFFDRLEHGELWLPGSTWGGTDVVPTPVPPKSRPTLFLVEVLGISSFLGDYGMGKTVKTLTLLPGEELKITMRTWRATSESIASGSSIIDSYNESAVDRFVENLQSETSASSNQSSETEWYVDAEASANWGTASASVSAGASGAYHSGREEFARQVDDTTKEHTNEASASREMSVTSSSEVSEQTEDETVTERLIKNVNMRRTLNFVFRELNQEFITKTHLREVRIAYSDGMPGSYREVAISGMRGLLANVLAPDVIDDVSSAILNLIAVTFDVNDNPVPTLERVTMNANGSSWSVAAATRQGNTLAPPTERMFYRYKRGPLNQEGARNQVEGVLLKERTIVMRTDSVAVEALLGQADALDDYAMEVQQATAEAATLKNERERLAHATLNEIADPLARAEWYARLFNPPTP